MSNPFTPLTLHAGATAFGDGRHPTTLGVLAALDAIDPAVLTPAHALDRGAGSGILAMAMAQRFSCPVVAAEISAQAIEILQENLRNNGLSAQVTPVHSDGFDHPQIAARAPFDLITMNILAEPLLALAAPAASHLAPGGVVIVSGMLAWQEPQIREAYQSLGLELATRLMVGDWATLGFGKP